MKVKHNLNRRHFLKSTGLAAGALIMGQLRIPFANAQETGKRPILIHLSVSGGAHSLLGLNPLILQELYSRKLDPVPQKDSELYPAYRDDQLIKTDKHLLGEAASPLVDYAKDITIINGMMMLADSPLHETNEAFVNTGDEDGREELFVLQMKRQFDLSLFGYARGSFRSSITGGIPIFDLASASNLMGKAELLSQHGKSSNGRSPNERLKRELIEISKRFQKHETVRASLKGLSPAGANTFSDEWRINTLAAISAGIVNYAFVDLSSMGGGNIFVDTHSDHDARQKSSQTAIFNQLTDLIRLAKAIPEGNGSMYDRMVIMLTTDFARTSWAESRDGTGHNPHNNSMLLSGGLINTGLNLGQSTIIPSSRTRAISGTDGRSRLQALPFDFTTNTALNYEDGLKFTSSVESRPHQEGQYATDYIYPSNVMKTVALAMGLNPTGKLNRYRELSPLLKKG